MSDPTAATRKDMIESGQPQADLAARPGQTWTTAQMTAEFDVLGFIAPFVVVVRKSDGARGSLEFTHSPRVYFNFQKSGGSYDDGQEASSGRALTR